MGVDSDIGIDISLGHQSSNPGGLFGNIQQGRWRSFESIIVPLANGVAVVPIAKRLVQTRFVELGHFSNGILDHLASSIDIVSSRCCCAREKDGVRSILERNDSGRSLANKTGPEEDEDRNRRAPHG